MKRIRIAAAAAYVAVIVAAARTDRAPDPAAGRQIYVSGSAPSGRAIAASLAGSNDLPATLLPCANCHGADGRGVAEGGVVPSNIRWLELTKPYRAATANGRRRPAYTDLSLRRAIVEGIDSAGNPLHAAMPRYAMAAEDLNDLVAYLKVLGGEDVPGVTATSVRVATIVPDAGPGAAAGAQMKEVLAAYFADAGEIHGRRIALEAVTPAKLEASVQTDPPFALAGGLVAGADPIVNETVERAAIPLVLPVSIHGDASAGNRQRFYLSPGIEAQLDGLLRFTAEKAPLSRLVVVVPDAETAALARRAAERLADPPAVTIATASADVAAELDGSTAVVFLDPGARLAGVPLKGKSRLLFLGGVLPEDFFDASAAYGDRIAVALTTTPGDLTPRGVAEFRAFAARHGIPGNHVALQLSAYAAAKAFVHALKQSGRELSRDSLRAALESLYEFETGVTPPLTFGRGRRIAAPRVYVATIDRTSGDFVRTGSFNAGH